MVEEDKGRQREAGVERRETKTRTYGGAVGGRERKKKRRSGGLEMEGGRRRRAAEKERWAEYKQGAMTGSLGDSVA